MPFAWVGGAEAYHQHHPVSNPPREHLAEIVRNAKLFHRTWGRWPMVGWLTAFRRSGLIDWDEDGATLTMVSPRAHETSSSGTLRSRA